MGNEKAAESVREKYEKMSRALRRVESPAMFEKHEPGELRALRRDFEAVQRDVARQGTEFLRAAGFAAGGGKRKKR